MQILKIVLLIQCFYLIAFSGAVLPLITSDTFNEKRLLQVLIFFVVFIFHLFSSSKIPIAKISKILIFIILCLGLLSVWNSESKSYAFIEFSTFVALFCYALLIAKIYLEHHQAFKFFLYIVFFAAGLYTFVFLVSYLAAFTSGAGYDWDELIFGFVNIRFFNQYQVWLLPFLTLLALRLKETPLNRYRILLYLSIVIWWSLLFLTSSRGAMLSIALTAIIIFIIYRKQSIAFLRIHCLFVLVGAVVCNILFYQVPQLLLESNGEAVEHFNRIATVESTQRLMFWKQAIDKIIDNPVLGIGPMHFAWDTLNHPHNSILQWAGEWGIPSALLVLIITVMGLFAWFKGFNKSFFEHHCDGVIKNETIALSYAMVSGLGYSLVSGVIVMPLSQLMMFTVIGFMLGLYQKKIVTIDIKPLFKSELIVWRIFVLAVFIAFIVVLIDVDIKDKFFNPALQKNEHIHVFGPRLLRNGGIPHQ